MSGEGRARILVVNEDHCVATWRRFAMIIWRKDTTFDGAEALRRALAQLSAAHPDGIALVTVVERTAPPPPSAVRDVIAEVLAEFGGTIKFSGVAFEGSGFRAAMVRGVVSGLTLLSRMPYPHKVFDGVPAASEWLIANLRSLGWTDAVGELIEAVAEVRAKIAG